jgi:small nuclear ribonucleoprotein (snRNP)-like protein
MSANIDGPTPVLIELHDARLVDGVHVHVDGTTSIHLANLTTYDEIQPDLYEVHSSGGTLVLRGCSQVQITGPLDGVTRVSDAYVFEADEEVAVKDLLAGRAVSSLLFVLDNGTRVAVVCTEASLTLTEERMRLRNWTGPLVRDNT